MLQRLLKLISLLFSFVLFLSYLSPYIDPQTFLWPIAFLGLFYPIILLVNCLFLIYWLIRFKRQFWSILFIILIGYSHLQTLVNIQQAETAKSAKFSVMSFNVRLFNVYDWINEKDTDKKIFDYINKSNLSIVCLQEFYSPNALPPIDYKYSHIGLQNKRTQWRMATYSNYPIINKQTVSIQGESKNNVCIYSDIILEQDTIRVYNVHLASNIFQKGDYQFLETPTIEGAENIFQRLKNSFQRRSEQVKSIKKHISTSPYPILLCGDFNDTPNSYAYKQLTENLEDAFVKAGTGLGRTYNGKFPSLRIDFILASPELMVSEFIIEKVNLSDHYPISISFE